MRLSLLQKVLVTVLGLFIAAGFSLSTFNYIQKKNSIIELYNSMMNIVISASHTTINITTWIEAEQYLSQGAKWLAEADRDNVSFQRNVLKFMSDLYGSEFIAVYSDGSYLIENSSTIGKNPDFNHGSDLRNQAWYKEARDKQIVVIPEVTFKDGKIMGVVGYPIKRNGSVIGAIGWNLDMTGFQDRFKNFERPELPSMEVTILNSSGKIISDEDTEHINSSHDAPVEIAIKQALSSGKTEGEVSFVEDGDEKVGFYKSLPVGWTIVAYTDQKDFTSALNEELIETFLVCVVLIVVGCFVLFVVLKKLFVPIGALSGGLVKFFSYLNYETKEPPVIVVNSKDELGMAAEMINANISKTKANTQTDAKAIEQSMQVAKKIEGGDLTARIEINPASPQLLQLKNVLNEMLNDLQRKIGENTNEIARVFNSYTNRDFTTEVGGKVGRVGEVTNILGKQIREIFSQNLQTAENLLSKSKALKELVETLTDGANTQARSLEESSAAVEEMSSSMNAINERSTEVIKQTEDIKGVTGVIRDIADQINLLALNAAIEAARAGEHGRGFAVVADEVRKLAEKTSKSLTEIEANINVLVQSINEMSESIKEQTQAINQINDAIVHIDETTKN
nr:methyl-accepting chemotaxis protein [Campylobacter sp.]